MCICSLYMCMCSRGPRRKKHRGAHDAWWYIAWWYMHDDGKHRGAHDACMCVEHVCVHRGGPWRMGFTCMRIHIYVYAHAYFFWVCVCVYACMCVEQVCAYECVWEEAGPYRLPSRSQQQVWHLWPACTQTRISTSCQPFPPAQSKKIIKIGIFLRKIYTLISHMLMSANSWVKTNESLLDMKISALSPWHEHQCSLSLTWTWVLSLFDSNSLLAITLFLHTNLVLTWTYDSLLDEASLYLTAYYSTWHEPNTRPIKSPWHEHGCSLSLTWLDMNPIPDLSSLIWRAHQSSLSLTPTYYSTWPQPFTSTYTISKGWLSMRV